MNSSTSSRSLAPVVTSPSSRGKAALSEPPLPAIGFPQKERRVSKKTPHRKRRIHIPERHSVWVRILMTLLCVIAVWSFAWPVYRAFLHVEIDNNEGWNAYFADAAMGKMPLYPAPEKLITNNYPPLSFYIVGEFGRLIHDTVLAGRLISLFAVVAIAIAIAMLVCTLGGNRGGAAVAGAFFVAVMSRYYTSYVGMNDPQLLAQAVMACAFVGFAVHWFAQRTQQEETQNVHGFGPLLPILLMVVAGFIKHNIIAMPLTAFLWLLIRRPRQALKCYSIAIGAVIAG